MGRSEAILELADWVGQQRKAWSAEALLEMPPDDPRHQLIPELQQELISLRDEPSATQFLAVIHELYVAGLFPPSEKIEAVVSTFGLGGNLHPAAILVEELNASNDE
jgi:hypothetical protein